MVTINDIAKMAGVAKSTVSRYLNGGSISKKTKAKLDAIVAETGYTPNTFAQSLKAKRTNIVGTIVNQGQECFSLRYIALASDKSLSYHEDTSTANNEWTIYSLSGFKMEKLLGSF